MVTGGYSSFTFRGTHREEQTEPSGTCKPEADWSDVTSWHTAIGGCSIIICPMMMMMKERKCFI